jgi:hypothetical protein
MDVSMRAVLNFVQRKKCHALDIAAIELKFYRAMALQLDYISPVSIRANYTNGVNERRIMAMHSLIYVNLVQRTKMHNALNINALETEWRSSHQPIHFQY